MGGTNLDLDLYIYIQREGFEYTQVRTSGNYSKCSPVVLDFCANRLNLKAKKKSKTRSFLSQPFTENIKTFSLFTIFDLSFYDLRFSLSQRLLSLRRRYQRTIATSQVVLFSPQIQDFKLGIFFCYEFRFKLKWTQGIQNWVYLKMVPLVLLFFEQLKRLLLLLLCSLYLFGFMFQKTKSQQK